jgi:hypothetical protein
MPQSHRLPVSGRLLEPRVVFLGVLLAALSRQFVQPVTDTDFWWHLADGRWIIEHGRLPGYDLYTHTATGHAWVLQEWLSEIVLYGLWQVGGPALISLFFGAVGLAGMYLLWRTADRGPGGPLPFVIVGLGLFLGALAGAEIWTPRFQMWDFLFSCLLLYWLDGWVRGRSRALAWFPLVAVLWTNLHAGFLIGAIFLGIGLVALVVRGWLRFGAEAWPRARGLALILVATLLAALINPYAIGIYGYSLGTVLSPGIQGFITEWQSPNFHDFVNRPYELMILLVAVGFALRRPALHELLLVTFTLALSLQSVRHVALFVAAATPVLIRSYSAGWEEWSRRLEWRLPAPRRSLPLAAVGALALVAVAARIGLDLASQPAVTRATFPVAAADWLSAHPEVGGSDARMFNSYYWGGYLIYRFYPDPRRRVFVFGEAYLVGDRVIADYADVEFVGPAWRDLLDRYRVTYVVDPAGGPLDRQLAEAGSGWTAVYRDRQAVIYVRE